MSWPRLPSPKRLPVVVTTNPTGVRWYVWQELSLVANGSGRLVEWHRLGCKCEAPGVC
jgi:hypothetical protein